MVEGLGCTLAPWSAHEMSDNILRTPHEVAEHTASGTLDGVLVEAVDLSKQGLKAVHASDVTFKRVALHHIHQVIECF